MTARQYVFDIAVDDEENIFLADWGNRRVLKVSAKGTITTAVTSEPPWTPEGLAVTGDRLILFESTGPFAPGIRPRLRALDASGKTTVLYEHPK